MSTNLENSAVVTKKDQFSFQSLKRAVTKNAQTTRQLYSFCMLVKIIFKILQARLQQDVNWELPDVQTGFRKGRETRDQITNICQIIKKVREFQKKKHLFLLYWLCQAFDCVDHNKLWKILTRSSPRLTSIESVMPSSHLIFCRPLLFLPPIPASIRVFSNEELT